jgi:hypothetical protein
MDRQSQEPTRDHTPACQSALSVKNRCIAKDQIWPRAAMAGLGKGQMGEGGLREASCDVQTTAVCPRCSPEKKARRCG